MAYGRHFENRYIAISRWKIIWFPRNFVHSSRFWTAWTSRHQKWKSCIRQTPSSTERIFCYWWVASVLYGVMLWFCMWDVSQLQQEQDCTAAVILWVHSSGAASLTVPSTDDFLFFFHFFTARCICISAVYAVTRCLSVCLFITFVSCAKTNKGIFEIFSPSGSDTILVFPYQRGCRYSNGNPPNGGVEYKGVWKIADFFTNISLYLRNGYT